MKNTFIKILLLLLVIFTFNSCYEDYLIINSEFKCPVITEDSSIIFFIHVLKVGQPPRGISRFPDGGTHKGIYGDISLFGYDINNKKLYKIHDFGRIPFHQTMEHIALQKNSLVFSLSPLMGWSWIKQHNPDSVYTKIYDDYAGFYKYDISTKSLNRFVYNGYYPEMSPDEKQIIYLKRDTTGVSVWHLYIDKDINQEITKFDKDSPLYPIVWKDTATIYYRIGQIPYEFKIHNKSSQKVDYDVNFHPHEIAVRKVRELTSEITFKEWGFDIQKYWPKSKKELIDDIIKLNGNLNYRKAILQSLSSDLSKKDIENILQQMEDYQNSLEIYEVTVYKISSTETKDLLKSYLN